VLIIDDVITTGATIFSICDEINKYTPASIMVFAIASGK
jgi:predicted amidophosphoribosyltransferase